MVIQKIQVAILEKEFCHLIHPHLASPVKGGGTLLPSFAADLATIVWAGGIEGEG